MAGIPQWVYRKLGQAVTIEPYGGVVDGAEVFGAAVAVTAVVEETDATARVVAPEGDQQTTAVLRCPLLTNCPSGSRITLASGRSGIATSVKRWDGGTSAAPSHLEIAISASADV